eukprot:TRINITY_DN14380_c0_g3_i1.p1 TRINITY_DN14380_c0_g3~~TRINITY_DN14380_c0_g3_i1.p1  ORF type:complete len:1467 (-),score=305.55 TRINITY_DN14380_c0_g3_i1:106-4506(-)
MIVERGLGAGPGYQQPTGEQALKPCSATGAEASAVLGSCCSQEEEEEEEEQELQPDPENRCVAHETPEPDLDKSNVWPSEDDKAAKAAPFAMLSLSGPTAAPQKDVIDLKDIDVNEFLIGGDEDCEDESSRECLSRLRSAVGDMNRTPGMSVAFVAVTIGLPRKARRASDNDRWHVHKFDVFPFSAGVVGGVVSAAHLSAPPSLGMECTPAAVIADNTRENTSLQALPTTKSEQRFRYFDKLHKALQRSGVPVPRQPQAGGVLHMFRNISTEVRIRELHLYFQQLLQSEAARRCLLLKAFFTNFDIFRALLRPGKPEAILTEFGREGERLWRQHCALPDFNDWVKVRALLPFLPEASRQVLCEARSSAELLWRDTLLQFGLDLSPSIPSVVVSVKDVTQTRQHALTRMVSDFFSRTHRISDIKAVFDLQKSILMESLDLAERRLARQRSCDTLLLIPHGFKSQGALDNAEAAQDKARLDHNVSIETLTDSKRDSAALEIMRTLISQDRATVRAHLQCVARGVPEQLELLAELNAFAFQGSDPMQVALKDATRCMRESVEAACAEESALLTRFRQEARLVQLTSDELEKEQHCLDMHLKAQATLVALAAGRDEAMRLEQELRDSKARSLCKHLDTVECSQDARIQSNLSRRGQLQEMFRVLKATQEQQQHRNRAMKARREYLAQNAARRQERLELERERLQAQRESTDILIFEGTEVTHELHDMIAGDTTSHQLLAPCTNHARAFRETGLSRDDEQCGLAFEVFQQEWAETKAFDDTLRLSIPQTLQMLRQRVYEDEQELVGAAARTTWELTESGEEHTDHLCDEISRAQSRRLKYDAIVEKERAELDEERSNMDKIDEWISEELPKLQPALISYGEESETWEYTRHLLDAERLATEDELALLELKVVKLYAPLCEDQEGACAVALKMTEARENSKVRFAEYAELKEDYHDKVLPTCHGLVPESEQRRDVILSLAQHIDQQTDLQMRVPYLIDNPESTPSELKKSLELADEQMAVLTGRIEATKNNLIDARKALTDDDDQVRKVFDTRMFGKENNEKTKKKETQRPNTCTTGSPEGVSNHHAQMFWKSVKTVSEAAEDRQRVLETQIDEFVGCVEGEFSTLNIMDQILQKIIGESEVLTTALDEEHDAQDFLDETIQACRAARQQRISELESRIQMKCRLIQGKDREILHSITLDVKAIESRNDDRINKACIHVGCHIKGITSSTPISSVQQGKAVAEEAGRTAALAKNEMHRLRELISGSTSRSRQCNSDKIKIEGALRQVQSSYAQFQTTFFDQENCVQTFGGRPLLFPPECCFEDPALWTVKDSWQTLQSEISKAKKSLPALQHRLEKLDQRLNEHLHLEETCKQRIQSAYDDAQRIHDNSLDLQAQALDAARQIQEHQRAQQARQEAMQRQQQMFVQGMAQQRALHNEQLRFQHQMHADQYRFDHAERQDMYRFQRAMLADDD